MLLHERLRQQLPHAKQTTLRRLVQAGRVRVNGEVASRWNRLITETDRVEIAPARATASTSNEQTAPAKNRGPHPLKIHCEDDDLLVVEKPAGLLTSTVARERRPTALALLRNYLGHTQPTARLGLIHRLDKDASGLLVFSKNEPAYRALKQQFFEHTVERIYLAITLGVPSPAAGRVEDLLVELPDGTVRRSRRPGTGERAVSDYQTLARTPPYAAVRVQLQTGRKHQIRVHLASRGAPIIGDRLYTPVGPRSSPASRLMLAALVLGFLHPRTQAPLRFELKAPTDFPLLTNTTLPN